MYNKAPLDILKNHLLKQGLSLAVAESVTSGHLQAAFSSIDDSMRFFQGGITAYNMGQKVRHLKVDPIHAEEINCVSEIIAKDMALNVADMFTATIGISITGYASPIPELGIKNIYAIYAIAQKGKVVVCKKISSKETNAVKAQIDYTNQVIKAAVAALKAK